MKNRNSFFFSLFLILLTSQSYSKHIIGGEIYYDCLGYGNNGLDTTTRNYLITIKFYRDCAGGGPQFDKTLGFSIYRKSGNYYVNTKSGTGSNGEYRVPFTIPVQPIAPPDYPCLELPPGVCGEAGIYEMLVELPIIKEHYVIVWQKCCRNATITNINRPASTGVTFTIEIHPEGQRTCNSSPRFKELPPTVLCVNTPFKYDHSAIDKEGDQLIYEFCEPLKHRGPGCNSGATNDCPPPYDPVDFIFPYSALAPLGGKPPLTINSFDGVISGTPNIMGQFVVSVCVYEYRNGILLSTLKRDFQFNIANCRGVLDAKLLDAKLVKTDHFEITVCGTKDYQLLNASTEANSIKQIMWTYENGGKMDTFFGWAPYIKFKEGGIHNGKFILNPYSDCGDTGYFKINIIPDIKADFTADYDTCKAGIVKFANQSSSSYSNISSYSWSLGDGFTSLLKDPQLQYPRPGTYPVLLSIKDDYGCASQIFKEIKWYPAPNVIVFRPNVNEGCVPLEVEFKNVSFPTDNSYKFLWRFSDGTIDSGYTVKHTFDSTGVYGMKLEITSPLGCYNEGEFKNVIYVFDPPTATWTVDSTIINFKNPVINVSDKTTGTIGRTWIIDGKEYFYEPDLRLVLSDTGYHHIRMIATDRFLCTDTLDTEIFVYRDFTLFMPNAFTPNGDSHSDVFGPVGQIHSLEKYELNIYDRWGGKVFSSDSPDKTWNGRFENTGADLPPGSYVYDLVYKVIRKEVYHERKMVTLIK